MLKKRGTAIVILIAVAVLGILFGTHRSLNHLRHEAREVSYQGAEGDGYGIDNKLHQRSDKAADLCKVAARYALESETEAVREAITALDSAKNAGEACEANRALTAAVDTLSAGLELAALSEEDAAYRVSLTADLTSYELQLERLAEDYNQKARAFNRILDSFPAGILARITGLHTLEEFA